jgi:ATP diphosphatase
MKIHEELEELEDEARGQDAARIEEELGDLLFAVVNLARHLDVDAEQALTRANRKFERRFRAVEAEIAGAGLEIRSLDIEKLEEYWRKAKKAPS